MISILIPACNEAERIGATLASACALLDEWDATGEIVVVDDGSTDDTAALAEAVEGVIVYRQENQGKGAALQTAFALAQGEILLLLDADLGDTAREATKLLEPVITHTADMTIATFPIIPGKGGGVGLVVRLARWGIRKLTGMTMTAPLSGQRAVRRELLEEAGGFAPGWGAEIGLTVDALRAGFRVLEIPTTMTHRVTGRSLSGIGHRAAQFVAAARVLWHLWRTPAPALPSPGPVAPKER